MIEAGTNWTNIIRAISHFFSLAGREWRRRERRGAVAGHKGATVAADNIYNIRYRVHVKKATRLADLV